MMRLIGAMGLCVLTLAGCTQTGNGGGIPRLFTREVTNSVAIQALGTDAFSVNPFVGTALEMPGIYAVRDNGRTYKPLCENDTTTQNAIKSMVVKSADYTDIIEDDLSATSVQLNILGASYETPYTRTKVSSYTVKRLISGDSRSAADWVLANVAPRCRTDVLPRNKPYIVVDSIAIAANAETIKGGGFGNISFALGGIGTARVKIESGAEKRTHNRIFAITGKVVAAPQKKRK